MAAAYGSLSDRMKDYLTGLTAIHSWDLGIHGLRIIFGRGSGHYINRMINDPRSVSNRINLFTGIDHSV